MMGRRFRFGFSLGRIGDERLVFGLVIKRFGVLFCLLGSISACRSAEQTSSDQPEHVAALQMGDCARPDTGCPCFEDTPPVRCGTRVEGQCSFGVRVCEAGIWSSCRDGRDEPGVLRSALEQPAESCADCEPTCSVARGEPNDGDLTLGNSEDVVFHSGSGGIGLRAVGAAVVPPSVTGMSDVDGDGVADIADEFPNDPTRVGRGSTTGFFHVLPFGDTEIDTFTFDAFVTTADVYILMDSTGSMDGEIANLQTALTTGQFITGCTGGLVGAIQCTIPNAWVGLGRYDDFPVSSYGGGSDVVFAHVVDITDDFVSVQTGVNSLFASGGSDWPEGQTQAMYAAVTGDGFGSYLSPRGVCPDADRWGYPCFRADTIPILLHFTDAPMHNGSFAAYDYLVSDFTPTPPPALRTVNVPPSAEDFANAHDIGDVTTDWVDIISDTTPMGADLNGSCWFGEEGPDSMVQFSVSENKTYRLYPISSLWSFRGAIYDASQNLVLGCITTWWPYDIFLNAGNYFLLIDNYGYDGTIVSGVHTLRFGTPPAVAPPPFPVSWSELQTELTARETRVITVNSGGTGTPYNDAVALANLSSSVDGSGNPFVFNIAWDGTGLDSAVVDAIDDLANATRFDISVRAVDNPATTSFDETTLVDSVIAESFPPGRCDGISADGSMFDRCLPGTTLNFEVNFFNDVAPATPTEQVFDFTIEVLLDGSVQDILPVRIVVPPTSTTYEVEGFYLRDFDASDTCAIPPQRPDWKDWVFDVSTPSDSELEFEFRTANTQAELGSANPVSVIVPSGTSPIDVGQLLVDDGESNFLPFLRVTSKFRASSDQTSTPILRTYSLEYQCVDSE